MPQTAGYEIAYLAGVFDGEGCASIAGRRQPRLSVEMSDLDVVERFQAAFGGAIYGPRTRGTNKPIWQWYMTGGAAATAAVAKQLIGFVGERRKAKLAQLIELGITPSEVTREKILAMKADLGWTQGQIADRLGIHQSTVSKYVAGKNGVLV